jgi:hypothetical protein
MFPLKSPKSAMLPVNSEYSTKLINTNKKAKAQSQQILPIHFKTSQYKRKTIFSFFSG